MFINNVFRSLSGEGLTAGLPSIFIRLNGCKWAQEGHPCVWCDTKDAWVNNQLPPIYSYEIISRVLKIDKGISHIVITGGEPFDQYKHVVSMCEDFLKLKFDIEIETNGSIDFVLLDLFLTKFMLAPLNIVMDIKCPSSENESNLRNLKILRPQDSIKFVVQDDIDLLYVKDILINFDIKSNILISPVWGKMDSKNLAQWIIDNCPRARLSLQIHKILGIE